MEVSEYIESRIGKATDTERLISRLVQENCGDVVGLRKVKKSADSSFREVVWPFKGSGYLSGTDVTIIYHRDFDAEAIRELSLEELSHNINQQAIDELRANVFGDVKVSEILSSVPDGEHIAAKVLGSDGHKARAGMEILIIGDFCMYMPYHGKPGIKSMLSPEYSGFLLEPDAKRGTVTVGEGLKVFISEPCEIDPFFAGRPTEEVLRELFTNGLKGGYPSL